MMKAILIKPNGEVLEVSPENGTDFKLKELYKLVECDCIDIVGLFDGRSMVVDDNGIANNLEVNRKASQLYRKGRMTTAQAKSHFQKANPGFVVYMGGNEQQNIYGNALICDRKMIK